MFVAAKAERLGAGNEQDEDAATGTGAGGVRAATASSAYRCGTWKRAQARPASISSLVTVLIDTSVTRLIARIDDPSQSIDRIWTRFSGGSLFIPIKYELLCLASSIFFIYASIPPTNARISRLYMHA